MGKKNRNVEWGWEYCRARYLERYTSAENMLPTGLCRGLNGGHAYLPKELQAIRQCLRLKANDWPDRKLHAEADIFAAFFGVSLLLTSKKSARARTKALRSKIINPANTLIVALNDRDFLRELVNDARVFINPNARLKKLLSKFLQQTQAKVELINSERSRGRRWDSDLKREFIDVTAMFCEYLSDDFEVSRNVQDGRELDVGLLGVAKILGEPVFGKGARYETFVREHVDEWVENKRRNISQVLQELRMD